MRVQGAGGPANHCLFRAAAVLLLAGTAGITASSPAAGAAAAQTPTEDANRQPIIVVAPPFRDVTPERTYDEDAIESYGVSTIDELVGEVQVELGDVDDTPLIIVNGKRINDLDEIGALPVEALRNLQVLPRGSAVKMGGTTGQRVISLTLKRKVTTETLTAAGKIATDGDYHAERGEAILTRVNGNQRLNLTLRGRADSSILESERGIIQPVPTRPYALGGNIVGFPNTSEEIDPLLSALAGEVVTVAPVPTGIANPTLADFATNANQPATTDLGEFRTLRPKARNYDFNGTYATPIFSWLTGTAAIRLNRSTTDGLRGLPSALFVLPDTNPASPFSKDVGLAAYGADPLHFSTKNTGGEANVTLNATWGSWIGTFNAKHTESKFININEFQTGQTPLGDTTNPFTTDLTSLIAIGSTRTTSHYTTNLADLSVTGPLLTLPAGPVQTTFEGSLTWDTLHGTSSSVLSNDRNSRRNQQLIRGAIDVPLTSRENNVLPWLGNMDATAEYTRVHYSDAGSVGNHTFGLTWEPHPVIRLFGELQENQQPAPVEILGSPVIVTPDVRVFDPLTGETVDVTQITGGNPDLAPQKTKIKRASAILRLIPRLNFQLNAEYSDIDRQNFVSVLPEASAAVMLAFPERYIRNPDGVLTVVDLRPVNFDSERTKQLRWGISMNVKVGGAKSIASALLKPGAKRVPPPRPTYFQFTANHTMVFSDEVVIRSGLPPVDLLHGGAVGIGGGRLHHQLDATAQVNAGGTGGRLGITWRGKSSLNSRINGVTDTLTFSPTLLINARAFTDLKRFLPNSPWAKGFRISLDLINITNDRQEVRDSHGDTPLRYQPGYRDPIGRTIEIEFRKVF